MRDPKKPYVFISYKREDVDQARRIRTALRARIKDEIWWDRDLKTGGQWAAELDNALRNAACVVVLWSERAVQSPWVQKEAAAAQALNKLVPACLDKCAVPDPYTGVHATMLTNPDYS